MKAWLVEYLSISRKERTGFLVLIVLISLVWLLPRFFSRSKSSKMILAKADSVLASSREKSTLVAKTFRLFTFDPNTLDEEGWRELGLTEKNIKTIQNYLDKGGRFRDPKDIRRIYGLRSDVTERLEPYIRIKGGPGVPHFTKPKAKPYQPFVYSSLEKRKPDKIREIVNLNEADTSALIALPGIGSKLAQRIILFRERCGGFYDVKQLAEVYGLKDSVFLLIKPRLTTGNYELKRLKINILTADSLAKHPYIHYSEAKAIVQYRVQHGLYSNAEDLLNVAIITREWLEKLRPYLDFN